MNFSFVSNCRDTIFCVCVCVFKCQGILAFCALWPYMLCPIFNEISFFFCSGELSINNACSSKSYLKAQLLEVQLTIDDLAHSLILITKGFITSFFCRNLVVRSLGSKQDKQEKSRPETLTLYEQVTFMI